MKVCYFGSYDKYYSRNRILIKGLIENGVSVYDCNNRSNYLKRVIKLSLKYLKIPNHEAIIVGAMGHANVLPAYIFSRLFKRVVIFDPFISLYDTAVLDRKIVKDKSIKSIYYFYLDSYSCKLSDKIIVDTYQHLEYFSKTFKISKSKIDVIYIGADDSIFYPKYIKKRENKFIVEFHGSFVPLQGVEYIAECAKILKNEKDVIFKIIGKGQTYNKVNNFIKRNELKNVELLGWVKYEKIPIYIAESDICLGIFGNTQKAKRVVPNKAFEVLAMKKPLITGDSKASREILKNKKHALLCEMANPEALADAILELKDNDELRKKIATCGYKLFKKKFTPKALGFKLKQIIENLI